jgi:uncharacterized protein YecA (UPF0149 family)
MSTETPTEFTADDLNEMENVLSKNAGLKQSIEEAGGITELLEEMMDHQAHQRAMESHYAKSTPIVRQSAKIGRNDPCVCGSGNKFKKCCIGAY